MPSSFRNVDVLKYRTKSDLQFLKQAPVVWFSHPKTTYLFLLMEPSKVFKQMNYEGADGEHGLGERCEGFRKTFSNNVQDRSGQHCKRQDTIESYSSEKHCYAYVGTLHSDLQEAKVTTT
jgi:hypothetical protein